jgi:hypothetical protein
VNFRSMLENVRTRLGEELRDQHPSTKLLLLLLSTQVQNFLTEANLSGRPWAVDEITLSFGGGTGEFTIPADHSFGKPLEVYSYYPGDPNHITRSIDFVDLGSLYSGWDHPASSWPGWSLDGSPNTAQRLAFFRKSGDNQLYVRVLPVPQQAAQYKVIYQVGVYGETEDLNAEPVLPMHHALVEVRTALAALPHAQWSEDRKDNQDRRNDLRPTLLAEETMLRRNFRAYITTMGADMRPSTRLAPGGID